MWHAGEAGALPLFTDDKTCEFMNTVHSSATPELEDFLGKQGIPWDVFTRLANRYQKRTTDRRRRCSRRASNAAH